MAADLGSQRATEPKKTDYWGECWRWRASSEWAPQHRETAEGEPRRGGENAQRERDKQGAAGTQQREPVNALLWQLALRCWLFDRSRRKTWNVWTLEKGVCKETCKETKKFAKIRGKHTHTQITKKGEFVPCPHRNGLKPGIPLGLCSCWYKTFFFMSSRLDDALNQFLNSLNSHIFHLAFF